MMKVYIYGPIPHVNVLRPSRYLLWAKNFMLFINSYMVYLFLFDVTLHEDNVKKMKYVCRSISELYVKVYF
jgi:hypothetical protein